MQTTASGGLIELFCSFIFSLFFFIVCASFCRVSYDHLDAQWHEDITFYCIHLNELRPLLIHEQARANLTSLSITQLDMYLMKEAEYRTSPSSMAATAAASSSPPSSAATSFRPLSTDSSHRASCDKLRLIRQTMSDSEASFYQIKG